MKDTVTVIRSDRHSLSIQVKPDGSIIVRAPMRCPDQEIRQALTRHAGWIRKKLALLEQAKAEKIEITPKMREDGIRKARQLLPERTAYFAARMGVDYHRITIRNQKTRWGSCSSKGNLNYNWKLALLPGHLIDYVVVHELAHRVEMNHSGRFWKLVGQQLPDYPVYRKELAEYARRLITTDE